MCRKDKMSLNNEKNSMSKTVKARKHHGADSLDITVPVEIVREHDITEGDVFEIEVKEEEGKVTLKYKRVYST